jgi:hypothetical protein
MSWSGAGWQLPFGKKWGENGFHACYFKFGFEKEY